MPESIRIQEDVVQQVKDPVEALRMLAETPMRTFSQTDWYGWSGCETASPMIGEFSDFTIVLDGSTLNIVHHEDLYGGTMFQLKGMD